MMGERTHRASMAVSGALAMALLTLLAVTPLSVVAKDGDVIAQGDCSGSTDWKLKLSEEDGGIEVEFEVDQNQNGKTWNVKLKRAGTTLWSGQRTTQGPSGSFEARRVINNGAGADQIVARAKYSASGEVCRGTATFSA
jgi:hypothetical protein